MRKTIAISSMVAAGALATALAATIPAAAAGSTEQCYGIALKGQNDCKAGMHDCKGMSTADYDGQSFKLVPAGTCITMKTPDGRTGSLMPIKS
jgi:uncharacterized membrane protein